MTNIFSPRMITRLAQIISSHVRFFLMKMTMHRYMNNNKHALHIQHYVMNCRCCCKRNIFLSAPILSNNIF